MARGPGVLGAAPRPEQVRGVRRTGDSTGSALSRRLEFEAVVAEMLLQLFDPPPDQGRAVERAGNIEWLAVAAERKVRLARVRAHVAEYSLHRGEVAVRRKTDRL